MSAHDTQTAKAIPANMVDTLEQKFLNRDATIAVIGLGYVGLPLMLALTNIGFTGMGFDIDQGKVDKLNKGESFIKHITSDSLKSALDTGRFSATVDFAKIKDADAILICVPTPLNKHREPDLTYVVETTKTLAPHMRPGQLFVLESTTYPGTTREILVPILEEAGLISGESVFVAYSPEREDPGNVDFGTTAIPKVVGGEGADAVRIACALYDQIVPKTVPVSTTDTAEAVKLTENIFRSVNITLVNELKMIYDAMGIDVWEVIEAAKTKPFGFMPFYPGPGLGGHCIPIDPFYLTWRARAFEQPTRFIELAGEISMAMPDYVVHKMAQALDQRFRKGLNGSKILIVGLAYKKNVDDMRESPSLRLWEKLEKRGAHVDYHDDFIKVVPKTREHAEFADRKTVDLTTDNLKKYDAVLIVTDHDYVDYGALVHDANLVIDTRNATKDVSENRDKIVKA